MAGGDSIKGKYEFLDHTADVQIHAWGDNLREAFENGAVAMMAYITDINTIEACQEETFEVRASDLEGLFYRFLDEALFLFNAEPYLVFNKLIILDFHANDEQYFVRAKCYGETFQLGKHPQGTEIKAITYSAMRIEDEPGRHEVYFIVDI